MKKITVFGLGSSTLDHLSLGLYKTIKQAGIIYTRTIHHPIIKQLEDEGVQFHSFDDTYEKYSQFDEVYEDIVQQLFQQVEKHHHLYYSVPGHPLVAEKTVQLLFEYAEKNQVTIQILGGQSFLDTLFTSLRIDPIEGFQLLDGPTLKEDDVHLQQHIVIGQVYDSFVASHVKLTLMEKLPDDYMVHVVKEAGGSNEQIIQIPLYELDRVVEVDNLTSLYVPPIKDQTLLYKQFPYFKQVIAQLRGPEGCPWDREQTHESLKKYLLEETYELIDAIDSEDYDHMIEELGDVLLQVVLHAQIGQDDGYFNISDVIETVTAKMIRRHPHVFQNVSVQDTSEVIANWEEIKALEKGEKKKSLLDTVPKSLPSLMMANKIQSKAAKVGFDWGEVEPMLEKLQEEIQEFSKEALHFDELKMKQEFGDILFAAVNISRYYKINPEEALMLTNQKFSRRFQFIEEKVTESSKQWTEFTLEELDMFWNEAKKLGL